MILHNFSPLFARGGKAIPYWVAEFDDLATGQTPFYGCAVDGSGNVYAAGETSSEGAGGADGLLVKYHASGSVTWQRIIGGAANERFSAVAVDGSGNVYAAGSTLSAGAGGADGLLVKYHASGSVTWQRIIGGSSGDAFNAVAIDGSGNVYAAGFTNSEGEGDRDGLLVKYDSSGSVTWQRIIGGASFDSFSAVAVDASGNVYAAGQTNSEGEGNDDALLVKYDADGDVLWQRILGGSNSDMFEAVAVDGSGNVYAAGRTRSEGEGSDDGLLVKYDASGNVTWQRILGGTGTDEFYGVAIDGSGNVYAFGYTESAGDSEGDFLVASYDPSGSLRWQRKLAGTDGATVTPEFGYGMAFGAGAIHIAGERYDSDSFNTYVGVLAKLPLDGSPTGTFGDWSYAATTLTAATSTLTAATSTLTAATPTLTAATSTLTAATSTLDTTLTTLD